MLLVYFSFSNSFIGSNPFSYFIRSNNLILAGMFVRGHLYRKFIQYFGVEYFWKEPDCYNSKKRHEQQH